MASNVESIADQDGDNSDWIEIYNSGSTTTSLEGYYLTDDPGDLTKWQFPATLLGANQYLLVFASDKDRREADFELHTNFKIDRAGEYLALTEPDGATVITEFGSAANPLPIQFEDSSYGLGQSGDVTNLTFVGTAAASKILVPSDGSLGDSWTATDFDDSEWAAAETGIGFDSRGTYDHLLGNGGDLGSPLDDLITSVYVRIPFQIADVSTITNLMLQMTYNDGFVAFLNGTRITSANEPTELKWNSAAATFRPNATSENCQENYRLSHLIPLLRSGTNVLAIQGLNYLGNNDMLVLPELHARELTDVSLGRSGFLEVPSPGAFNGDSFDGLVRDTTFSVERGFFDAPFNLEIATATEGATILYTTNGSLPTADNGNVYSGPITIDRTTPLRAMAVKTGMVSTPINTQTYVFVDDVVTQSPESTQSTWGLPSIWGEDFKPDYGMDERIVDDENHSRTIRDDLKRVPSLSIVMESDELFGSDGIYANPRCSGSSWERACSMEIIDPTSPDGSLDTQIDCGIRIQGSPTYRRLDKTPKKSFRVLFKGIYGPTKLRYPFFGTDAVDEFDTLTLRMGESDGYQTDGSTGTPRNRQQYARDEFNRRSQLAMGSPSPHGRYMHLYLNGVYWGIYNAVERPDASFGAAYFGANKDQWDGIGSGEVTNDGSIAPWNTLLSLVDDISRTRNESKQSAALMRAQGLNPDGTKNPAWESYIDIDNYIDFLLVNWWSSSGGIFWPNRGYYCGRERGAESEGFKFFCWDAESTWRRSIGGATGVAEPHDHLKDSLDYQIRVADRAHRAFFNDGPLTSRRSIDRYVELSSDHRSILVPELARWGDQHHRKKLPSMDDWDSEFERTLERLNNRTPDFLNRLRNVDLYPKIAAPVFSQHGGSISSSSPILMVTDIDTIFYTIDGSDPRLQGGEINPSAQMLGGGPLPVTFMASGQVWKYLDDGSDQGTAWREIAFDDSNWASGASQLGYGGKAQELQTEIGFGPDSDNKFPTTYFRTTVEIPDPTIWGHFLMRLKYDDGAAIYVNGVEVARLNLDDDANFTDFANSSVSVFNHGIWRKTTVDSEHFAAGTNTIAVEIHQGRRASPDIRLDMELIGQTTVTGGGVISDPLFLSESGTLKARSYTINTGEWSALNEAFFSVDTVPAAASNLVASEIYYHPAAPITQVERAKSSDPNDFEFVELTNIGTMAIDLTGVRFDSGIRFDFPEHSILDAGERLLVVRNQSAFEARYGKMDGVKIFDYSGRLNNDGELLRLTSTSTGVVFAINYGVQDPWPAAANGDGVSLVLIDPTSNPSPEKAANWTAGNVLGGTPGSAEPGTISYANWAVLHNISGGPDGDHNGDGISNVWAYLFGAPNDVQLPVVTVSTINVDGKVEDYFTISYRMNLDAIDATITTELSSDLLTWDDDLSLTQIVSAFTNGDGSATVVRRLTAPIGADTSSIFIRLRAR